ncbi:MAG: hypothetical protein RL329_3983 [Bacteroidota bacterium]
MNCETMLEISRRPSGVEGAKNLKNDFFCKKKNHFSKFLRPLEDFPYFIQALWRKDISKPSFKRTLKKKSAKSRNFARQMLIIKTKCLKNMSQKIVAGNWKMNKTAPEALLLAKEMAQQNLPSDVTVILATPALYLQNIRQVLGDKKGLYAAAQNCHHESRGAFTGEISAEMIQSIDVQYVIIGHSERREYFKENNAMIAKKVDLLLAKEMKPIFCCGEALPIREKGKQVKYVSNQIKEGLFHLGHADIKKIVIAYEPIWAIGTGLTATPEQAQDMHFELRKGIRKKYGNEIADNIRILYGGSCNASNAKTLFAQPDIDGGLIGGASLKAADFCAIIHSF